MSEQIDIVDDEEVVDEERSQPERAWDALDDVIDIVDEAPDETEDQTPEGPSIAELQAKVDALSGNRDDSVLAQSLQSLGEAIKTIRDPDASKQATVAAQETYADLMAKAKDGYFDAPVETVDKLIEAKVREMVAPAFTQLADKVQKTESRVTRAEAAADPTSAYVLENYGSEIDDLIKKGQTDVNEAVQQVAAKHMTEVINARVEQLTAAQQPAAEPARGAAPSTPRRAPRQTTERIQVTREQYTQLAREADDRGLPVGRYVKWVQDNQPERLRGRK